MSLCPYESRQCSSDTTGTSTFWRTRAKLPPSVVVPHPLTVQIVPSSYSSMLEDASQAASLGGGSPPAHGADRALVVLLHAV